MDYQAMTARQLQDECVRRNLPSGRAAKAAMVQRLIDAEAAQDDAGPVVELSDGTQVPQPDVPVTAQPDLLPPAPEPFDTHEPEPSAPSTFRATHQLGRGGLDDASHTEFRRLTVQAAAAAGHSPRGDAYRVGTTGAGEVYEVNIRRRT